MVQIVGKYQHVSYAPNFVNYLNALKIPEGMITTIFAQKPVLTITENGGQWTFHNADGGKEWSSTFKFGEPYDEITFSGTALKSVAKRDGDKIVVESTVHDSTDTKVYEFTDTGFTMNVSSPRAGNITSSVVYKRI